MIGPAVAGLDHGPRGVLGAEERAGQARVDEQAPLLERHVEHAVAAADPGVVDEHVEAAVPLDDRGDRLA